MKNGFPKVRWCFLIKDIVSLVSICQPSIIIILATGIDIVLMSVFAPSKKTMTHGNEHGYDQRSGLKLHFNISLMPYSNQYSIQNSSNYNSITKPEGTLHDVGVIIMYVLIHIHLTLKTTLTEAGRQCLVLCGAHACHLLQTNHQKILQTCLQTDQNL